MEDKEQQTEEKVADALEQELAELRDALTKEEENSQKYLEQIKRLQADFENWRKRVEKEKLHIIETASSVIVEKMLPILDNFERAFIATDSNETNFKEGMTLIHKQMMNLLKEEGLTSIEAIGKTFDPSLHEAIAYEERTDGEDHQIIEEARKGYVFKGKILRPALVKVSKLASNVTSSNS